MRSRLFHTDRYIAVQDRIKVFLNAQERFLSGRIADVEEPGSATGRDGAASVMLETAGRVHRIPWALVTRARLEVEL